MAAALALCTGIAAHAGALVAAACVLAACPGILATKRFLADPTPQAQARLDKAAGMWVLGSYAAVGFLPLVGHHP